MSTNEDLSVRSAEVVLPAEDLEATLAFFQEALGFRVESVFPADAPRVVVVVGHGLRVRLDRTASGPPPALVLRTTASEPSEAVAPNGSRIRFEPADPRIVLPQLVPELHIAQAIARTGTGEGEGEGWGVGRAGMQYRDLVPARVGGRYVASHIRIPTGGPVPDYVHYHRVAFQVIVCRRGRVRVVYEDQGPPFWMEPGDCVLQPPQIRHRVLECTDGLEVVEVTCPAEHETRADLSLELPTEVLRPEREFGGQRFVRHRAASADWTPWHGTGFVSADLGVAAGLDALPVALATQIDDSCVGPRASTASGTPPNRWADVRRVRTTSPSARASLPAHDDEFLLWFVLEGGVALRTETHGEHALGPADAACIPSGIPLTVQTPTADFDLLEVRVTRPRV